MSIKNPSLVGRITPSGPAPSISQVAEKEERSQEHFRTDHLLKNLKRRTISSGAITASAQIGKFLLSMVSTMVLARLLTPQDFGLVALVTTVTGFLRVFKDAGLSIATVQRETITHAQVSNLFWINVAVSGCCGLLVAATAPLLAWVYNDSRLIGITLLLSLTFLISGSNVQHQALLRRQMRFKEIALREIGAMATGVLVGVVMAVLGFGCWSLVGSSLSMEAASLVLTWSISRWRPQLPAWGSGTRPLLSFGAHRTAGDFILALARGSDTLLIGRVYGAEAVGLYSRAGALLIHPLRQLLAPINAVLTPALCRLQSQPERYRATFLRLYEAIAVASFFFTGLLLALARPLTLVMLGPKWEEAALIFGGFTFAALCIPISNSAAWLFTSQGRGKDMLVAQSIYSGAMVLSFVAGLPFGPVGVAIALSASNLLIRMPVYYFVVGRSGPVRTTDLWSVFFRHVPVWIVVLVVTSLARSLVVNLPPLSQLLICGPVGAFAGVAFVCSFRPQRQVAIHFFETLRELRKKR